LEAAYVWCNDNNNNNNNESSISRGASRVCDPGQKTKILTSKFSFFFSTPPIKLKPGLQIGGRLLISSQLDESLWLTNQKLEAAVRSITNQPGGAEYVTLAKKLFLTSKFSFSFLWTPPIKSKPGLQVGDY
jgi:hypothetical protein